MSKFLNLIRKSYLVLEAEGDPAAGGANPFGGGDAGAGGAPEAGGAPDAAMTPEPKQDPQQEANSAESQLKKNLDDLKLGISKFIENLSDVITVDPKSTDVEKLFSDLKQVAIDQTDSQKYIDKILKKLNPSSSEGGYDDSAQFIAKDE
jgi:hypothetical protein